MWRSFSGVFTVGVMFRSSPFKFISVFLKYACLCVCLCTCVCGNVRVSAGACGGPRSWISLELPVVSCLMGVLVLCKGSRLSAEPPSPDSEVHLKNAGHGAHL